jgi:hypothetical protein
LAKLVLVALVLRAIITNMKQRNIDKEKLAKAFGLLDGQMQTNGCPPAHLVVCGGSALIATDLVPRTTSDADVIALVDSSGNMMSGRLLPDKLLEIARSVADVLGLDKDWLNSGPAGLFDLGMPEGFEERLVTQSYGPLLTVSFVTRLDQVYLKLNAVLSLGVSYHLNDLKALNPTEEELIDACHWVQGLNDWDRFPDTLRNALREIGYASIADRI